MPGMPPAPLSEPPSPRCRQLAYRRPGFAPPAELFVAPAAAAPKGKADAANKGDNKGGDKAVDKKAEKAAPADNNVVAAAAPAATAAAAADGGERHSGCSCELL